MLVGLGNTHKMIKIQFNNSYFSIMKKMLIVLLLLFNGIVVVAQTDGSVKSKVKHAEQKKVKLAKNQHEAIQTKATRKRMKKHRKQRIHVNAYERKEFFLKRWLHKKEH